MAGNKFRKMWTQSFCHKLKEALDQNVKKKRKFLSNGYILKV